MVAVKKYETIRSQLLTRLENDLPADLFYHSAAHTMDVEQQAQRIARSENIHAPEDLFLLKIACLYHDTGFLFTYNNHEEAGCDLAKKELPLLELDTLQVDQVCGLIMATRIPQTPHNRLEEIICDADLDYLGRDDFFSISHYLYKELKARAVVETENDWNKIQVKFFRQHSYFTATDRQLRGAKKQQHLETIEKLIIK